MFRFVFKMDYGYLVVIDSECGKFVYNEFIMVTLYGKFDWDVWWIRF